MPANREDLIGQRVVVRNGFTCDLADMPVGDIRRHLDWFASQPGLRPKLMSGQFYH
jgi:glutamate decarboxylase